MVHGTRCCQPASAPVLHFRRRRRSRWLRVAEAGATYALAEDEIEVEVVAAGLNYRDVLVGLGILDDDLLGAGMTKAALGFECAGTVARVGPGRDGNTRSAMP